MQYTGKLGSWGPGDALGDEERVLGRGGGGERDYQVCSIGERVILGCCLYNRGVYLYNSSLRKGSVFKADPFLKCRGGGG